MRDPPIATTSPSGKALNKLLRRADWRFLLPDPRPPKSICFVKGLLGQAVGLISECVVDGRTSRGGDGDLAVAIDPDLATLRTAWASLRPGGSCYTEWYSPLVGGVRGVRRRLEAAGFNGVKCYWCWPRPSRSPSHYWLPFEAPGALRYFLRSRPPARHVLHRMLRAVWLLGVRLGLLVPVCAVARKPALPPGDRESSADGQMRPVGKGVPGASGATPDLLDRIRAGWQSWGLGPTPDTLSSLLLTPGSRPVSKLVALVFREPNDHPLMVVKMVREPEVSPRLRNEATTLQALQSQRPVDVRGVPRALFCEERAGLVMVGETVVTGRSLAGLIQRDSYRDLALKATDWLSDLAGRSPPCRRADWWDRLVAPSLANFLDSFGPIIDPGLWRSTTEIVATLEDLPLVCEHRDFAPWNVRIAPDGELAVLDWESTDLRGLPSRDLIYFLTYLAFHLDDAWNRESYRATLDPWAFTGGVRSECLARYVSRTGLHASALAPLRLLVWLQHARGEYHRIVADSDGRPEPERLRRSLFVSLWEEEVRSLTQTPPRVPS